MLLWFAGLSVVVVWAVFRDPAIDYRLVVAGAVAPDVLGAVTGDVRLGHAVLTSVVLLTALMLLTQHRRAARRRLLALPIGTFLHLVLDGVWARPALFWWPLTDLAASAARMPSLERPVAVVALQELVGAAAVAWCARRFRLHEPERRRRFLRSGRLGRDLLA